MTSRRKRCARQLDGGPGTCSYWWEGCRNHTIPHCFNAFVAENGGQIDLDRAKEWEAARNAYNQVQQELQLSGAAK